MHIKSKKYLKNRLNEFVSVSDLDISDLKDNLLPIIKGVDTYCWSYIKKRERNSSRVVSISLNTDSEFQRLFDAVKELEADQYICDTLGKHASSKYIEAKYAEWDEYRRQITNWEIDQYLYKI